MLAGRALQLDVYGWPPTLRLVEVVVPAPRPGEVLVQMSAAPVNPSDLAFIAGVYGFRKALPVVPGIEGSGVVVATGADVAELAGARVALVAGEGSGTWAEYVVANARLCTRLRDTTNLEAAASFVVNPTTAWALLESAVSGGHAAGVQTAAASALGKMVARLAIRQGYPVIHVVRRAAQVDELRALGASHVLDSSLEDFDARLATLTRQLRATIAFDLVGGALTGRVLAALPHGGRIVLIGALSQEDIRVHPGDLLFGKKRIDGFWLNDWLRERSADELARASAAIEDRLADDLKTDYGGRVTLDQASAAIREGGSGKLLITMD